MTYFLKRECHGPNLYLNTHNLLCRHGGAGVQLRTPRQIRMSWLYLLSGGVAAGLFVYLSIALLKPEWFS